MCWSRTQGIFSLAVVQCVSIWAAGTKLATNNRNIGTVCVSSNIQFFYYIKYIINQSHGNYYMAAALSSRTKTSVPMRSKHMLLLIWLAAVWWWHLLAIGWWTVRHVGKTGIPESSMCCSQTSNTYIHCEQLAPGVSQLMYSKFVTGCIEME